MNELLTSISGYLHQYLHKIAMAIIAALLALFGSHINGFIKNTVKKYNFFVRLMVFILVVTFGFGLLAMFLAHLLTDLLAGIPRLYLFPVLALIFIIIGLIAEEKKHI